MMPVKTGTEIRLTRSLPTAPPGDPTPAKTGTRHRPLAAVGLALALAPGVRESKEERARAEREAEQRQRVRRLRELRAEQRPVTGRLPAGGIGPGPLGQARPRPAAPGAG